MNTIILTLEDISFYAYHGHFEEEKKVGTLFTVSLKVETDKVRACETDELDDGLDYQQLHQVVAEEMKIPANLLEHAAMRIIQRLQTLEGVLSGKLTISKMNPPLPTQTKAFSVTIRF